MVAIAIIDVGIGNLRSVKKAFEKIGVSAPISNRHEIIGAADALVLPGVGAFRGAMKKMHELELVELLRHHVGARGKPLLGICLGMQLLARNSSEGTTITGLDLIRASVVPLDIKHKKGWDGRKLTLPHIGWNSVRADQDSRLFRGLEPDSEFYFVHSYVMHCERPGTVAATCEHGSRFAAAIEHQNIFATQFHPEKSQKDGAAVIENFVRASSEIPGPA